VYYLFISLYYNVNDVLIKFRFAPWTLWRRPGRKGGGGGGGGGGGLRQKDAKFAEIHQLRHFVLVQGPPIVDLGLSQAAPKGVAFKQYTSHFWHAI
jgi:hypothetical protein